MALMGVTETAAVGLALVSAYVQQVLVEQAVLIPSINDRSSELEVGAKSLAVGKATKFTAESKTENTAYTAQVMTWSADNLLLDKQEGVLVNAEDIATIQSAIAQETEILAYASIALMEKLEANIYTALAAASGSAPDHIVAFGSSTTLQTSDISNAALLLDLQKVPLTDRFLAVNPTQFWQIASSSHFIDAGKYGNSMPLMNGEVGQIFGFKVLKTTAVTINTCLAYHKTHVAFARQLALRWRQQDDLDNASMKYLLDTIYGLKTLDSGKRGVLINASGS